MTDRTGVRYRAAIVGTGRIGSTYDDEMTHLDPAALPPGSSHSGVYTLSPMAHAGAYRSLPGFALVAAANRGRAKLAAFGERWGVSALYTSYPRMLAAERPDVVSVCTQSPEKAEAVIRASRLTAPSPVR